MTASIHTPTKDGKPGLREAYENWLAENAPHDKPESIATETVDPGSLSVGIVGGGISGLYSALVLQTRGVKVKVFEAEPVRPGGRVYTHRFNDEANQYFEAGAMRLPEIPAQQPVFDLINYLNQRIDPVKQIELIEYVLYNKAGNLVYVNGRRGPDGKPMSVDYADTHPQELGFSNDATEGKTANELLHSVIHKFVKLLEEDFDRGFAEIIKYDDYSFRSYLAQVEHWSEDRINYVEVMTSQTNQFQHSFTELLIESMDFSQAHWKTIKNGMDRLPNAMVDVIDAAHIEMGTEVIEIAEREDGKITVISRNNPSGDTFDKVIMALPPAALNMIQSPQWSPPKTHAIRSLHFEPLYKIGMRFKTRFWEQCAAPASGGQSISDLPSRWVVYPSYGIGDEGPGVLLLYSWMTDAVGWLPQSEENRVRLALRDLQTLYGDSVDIDAEFIEAFEVNWTTKESTGDAMFFPGQFKNLFNVARQPEGNVYFAGEHLSVHHTWIVGAIDSALLACQQVLGVEHIMPLGSSRQSPDEQMSADSAAGRPEILEPV